MKKLAHTVQRCAARTIAAVLLALTSLDASAEPEMTFSLAGVRSTAAAAFQSEMQRARVRVREWWGATFEGAISVQVTRAQVLSMALVPA